MHKKKINLKQVVRNLSPAEATELDRFLLELDLMDHMCKSAKHSPELTDKLMRQRVKVKKKGAKGKLKKIYAIVQKHNNIRYALNIHFNDKQKAIERNEISKKLLSEFNKQREMAASGLQQVDTSDLHIESGDS